MTMPKLKTVDTVNNLKQFPFTYYIEQLLGGLGGPTFEVHG
jgi:hypothetical protein